MNMKFGRLTHYLRPVWFARLAVAALMFLLVVYSTQAAHADEPPDDCWGGTLSADRLHCHVIDQAHREGVIEVEGIYDDNNGALYIFFDYLRPANNWLYGELGDYFRQEGKEFAVQHPDLVSYDFDRHRCGTSSSFYDTIEECMMYYTFQDDFIVPWSVPYDRIWLRAGGADARRQEGGWASWTQVWPAMAADASGASGRFDVSEVDVTNFPELNCVEQEQMFLNLNSCLKWEAHPELDIAGWHGNITYFVQVKAPLGQEANVDTARAELKRIYTYDDEHLITIPVEYELKELWQWAVILNRFAISSGNTIGITGTEIAPNFDTYEVAVYPLADLQEAGGIRDYRETIHVWALDAQRVADSLPTLLPQLGIPVDAVGVVGQFSNRPAELGELQPAGSVGRVSQISGNAIGEPRESVSSSTIPIWVMSGVTIGLLALISTMFWVVRRRKGLSGSGPEGRQRQN